MADDTTKNAQRLVEVNREIQDKFAAYVRVVRDDILMSRFMGNEARAVMLEAGLKSARRDIEKMEQKLAKVLLSNAVVDALVGELQQVSAEADKLLKEMENLKKAFERMEQVANVISKALGIVTKFI